MANCFCHLHCAYVVNVLFAHRKCLMLDWIYVDKNTQSPWFEWICYINDVFGTNESIMHNFIAHDNTVGDKKSIKRLTIFRTGRNSRGIFAKNTFISAAANACKVCALSYILVSIFCFEKMNNIFGKYRYWEGTRKRLKNIRAGHDSLLHFTKYLIFLTRPLQTPARFVQCVCASWLHDWLFD